MHYAVEDLCAGLACHWGVWVKPPAFWAIFPEVPPCGGKEPRMTCQFGQDCHCTSVWLTVLRKLIPPNPKPIWECSILRHPGPHLTLTLALTSGNIPQDSSYGVFIAQTLRYARACAMYNDFMLRTHRLRAQIVNQISNTRVSSKNSRDG